MYRIILGFFIAGGLLAFAGCDSADDTNGPLVAGQANVTVTGAVTSSYGGQAFWTVDEDDDGEPLFGVFMLRGTLDAFDEDNFEIVALTGDDQPVVGTFSFAEAEHEGLYMNSSPQGTSVVWSTTGTMEITTSTATRLVGTASFTGATFTQTGPGANATIEAAFDATFIDPDDLPETVEVEFRPASH